MPHPNASCESEFTDSDQGRDCSAWHPLSAIQRSLWFLYRMQPALQGVYNIAFVARATPTIDSTRLHWALNVLARRHAMLRTRFVTHDGEPRQAAADEVDVPVEVIDVPTLDEAVLDPVVHRDRARAFDLTTAPLVRASLYRCGPEACVLLLALDHLVCDAWSLWQLLDELAALLSSDTGPGRRADSSIAFDTTAPSFAQHVAQQRAWLEGPQGQRQLAHWRTALARPAEPLDLPVDRRGSDAAAAAPRRVTLPHDLPADLSAQLRALAARHECSMFTVLLSAYFLLLRRLTGQRTLAVGSPMPARGAEWARTIGSFTNPVVLRADIDDGMTVRELLRQVQSTSWRALKNQLYPLSELVERLQPQRTASGQPYFQALFVAQKARAAERMLGLLAHTKSIGEVSWAEHRLAAFGRPQNNGGAGMDLLLEVAEIDDALMSGLDYDAARFSEATVRRWIQHWEQLLRQMTLDDDRPVQQLDMLPAWEREQVLRGWNDTAQPLQLDRCVHALVQEQARRRPQALAVVDGEQRLSYAQLNAQANRLALRLRQAGVGPDVCVGLCSPRGAHMLTALLAIWKAGGAYVPLDPGYPGDRLAHMLRDSRCAVVLTHGTRDRLAGLLPEGAQQLDLVDDAAQWCRLEDGDLLPEDVGVKPTDLAYVIYTSGSTGLPKGVMVEHRSLVNYALDARQWFGLAAQDLVLQQNSLNFDLSLEEIVPAWLAGAALAPSQTLFGLQGSGLQPSVVHLTAAHWHTLVGEWAQQPQQARAVLQGVRLINVTGDALLPQKVAQWEALRPEQTVLVNTYGPTEITVSCSAATVQHDPAAQRVSIGRPFANTALYLLDAQQQPVPIGVAGELYIGGEGVARGYLNRPDLTAERFLPDPFSPRMGARMYRTGDLARWRDDGEVEFIGRNDHQVKVRGYRIELGEVETQLAGAPGVTEAVVLAVGEHAGDKRLVAYLTGPWQEAAVRAHAALVLPEYMQPAAWVRLETLPKTPGGKLDRRALPQPPDGLTLAVAYEPPQGQAEETLARLWAELLQRAPVGRHDNFFALGGHSLLALQLVERLRRAGLHLPVNALFSGAATVAGLARQAQPVCDSDRPDDQPPNLIPAQAQRITPAMLTMVSLTQTDLDAIVAQVPGGAANVQDIYPLTHAQEGILFHHRLQPERDAYASSTLLSFDRVSDRQRFVQALQWTVDRHDVLRTQMVWAGLDAPVQVVCRQASLEVKALQPLGEPGDARGQMLALVASGQAELDLSQAPLLRGFSVGPVDGGGCLLLLRAHHLILDNLSQGVLLQEVQAQMQALETLPAPTSPQGTTPQQAAVAATRPVPIPFRAFVAQARLHHDQAASDAYFRRVLADIDEPTLAFGLPLRAGDEALTLESSRQLPDALVQRLRLAARRHGVGLAGLLHLAWALVVARSSGQGSAVLGTVLMGRMQTSPTADPPMGMFINTLPLRVDIDTKPVALALQGMQQSLAELLLHEHASLAQAQRCSGLATQGELFNALFNYRHRDGAARPSDAALPFRVLHLEERSSYPVSMDVDDLGDALVLTAQVQAPVDAQRVCDHLQTALQSLAEALETAPDTPLCGLRTLPEAERRLVLETWNATSRELPLQRCVHQLIEQQAQQHPHAMAVLDGAQHLSYAELNAAANRLACWLRAQGVGPDVRVALCSARGADMLTALLAIWKAGGAYVPLDPAYPDERIAHMLADSASRVVLTFGTQGRVQAALPEGARCFDLQADAALWAGLPSGDVPVPGLHARHLAYVIYTSGSTGLPKGVMVEHRSLVNYALDALQWFKLDSADVVLQQNALNFDLSIEEIVPAWLAGAALAPSEQLFGLQALQHRPTMVHLTAAHWHTLVGEWSAASAADQAQGAQQARELLAAVRLVNVTGDALAPHMLQRWEALKPPHTALINTYGPTEITVSCSAAYVKHEPNALRVSIGKPFANTRLYILEPQGQPAPVGVVGELFIGGEGVARGYLNRPELTAERFVADPFASEPQARMYRTGDLARWREDGEVEFVGRNDFQVKVRGFRVELGEVEAQLAQTAGVSEVVVVARGEQAHEKRLVAYAVGQDDDAALLDRLRAQAQALPAYMQPAAYVKLQALPKTAGGKLDRKALPAPDDAQAQAPEVHEAPQGQTEQAIAAVWCALLKLPRVGRHDNFFALGGHSLLALQMVERLRRQGLGVSVRALFGQAPTVATLAQAALQAGGEAGRPGGLDEVETPPNLIAPGTARITPELLTLVRLTQAEIDHIVAQVPGGAANVQDIYPLTHAQEGILFHHQLQPEQDAYVETTLLSCPDEARLQRLLSALQQVVDRHDALRTQLVWDGLDQPVQVVHRSAWLAVHTLVQDDRHPGDPALRLRMLAAEGGIAVDLGRPPLLRLVTAEDATTGRHLVLMAAHHIIIDNIAQAVLLQELRELLAVPTSAPGAALALPAPRPYRDFVYRARRAQDPVAAEAFFNRLLGDIDEPTIAYGLAPSLGDLPQGADASHRLPRTLSLRLRQAARRHQVGLATLMHLAWALVLARASGQSRVVFGTVLLGRTDAAAQADRQIGMFINTLPLRVDIDHQPVAKALRALQLLLAELMQHEQASLSEAQRCSGVPGDRPLFNSLFNHRFGDIRQDLRHEGADFSVLHDQERSNYPLSLDVDDLGEDLSLTVQVDQRLSAARVVGQMAQALQSLAEALETAPDTPLCGLRTLPEAERRLVLETWNATSRELPLQGCVHELIEQQAQQHPHAMAVLDGAQHLSYAELNAAANRLACWLRAQGVGPDVRVALCCARGADMLTALLAIWKAGGAYVPLDPAYPDERIAHMLADSASRVVLTFGTQGRVQAALPEGARCFDLQADAALWAGLPSGDVPVPGLHARHLAYVIYTSGSTGLPKGVMVEHRSLVNYALDALQWFKLDSADVVLQQNALNFDLSIEEIVPAWLAGAALAPSEQLFGLQALQHRPTMVHLTAAHWHTLVGEWSAASAADQAQGAQQARELLAAVRLVNVTGDALAPHMLQRWEALKPPHTALINTYGPTEITVSCSAAYVKHEPNALRVSIGKPFANTRLYILEPQGQPAPVGVVGELFIGGEGVARGYLNRPELTAERFVADPFASEPQARMYRTGDLARWREDGEVEFVGRNDFQVKVRGFRVELGEVEAQLAQTAGVSEVVVVARGEQAHEKRLVAYAVGQDDDAALLDRLRAQAQALPAYMQPAAYVKLQALPKTAGGKLDRKALPAPDDAQAQAPEVHEAPQGQTEQAIAAVWCALLKLPRVGRHDNFFALGGHSLLALQMVERLRRQGLGVSVRALFGQAPTVATLAQAALQAGGEAGRPGGLDEVETPPNLIAPGTARITPELLTLVRLTQAEIDHIVAQVPGGAANVQDIYPLTHAQEGILFHHQLQPEQDPYLDTTLLACDEEATLQRLLSALQGAMDRHDALRTHFAWQGLRQPVQVVCRRLPLRVDRLLLSEADGDMAEQLMDRAAQGVYAVPLDRAPLLQVLWCEDRPRRRWLLLLLDHHAVLDHVAHALLLQEVQQALQPGQAPALAAEHPAVSLRPWVYRCRQPERAERSRAFWRGLLADLSVPSWPYGLRSLHADVRRAAQAELPLPTELAMRARAVARANKLNLATLTHMAMGLLTARSSGTSTVVFATLMLGRATEASDAIGMCLSTVPFRINFDGRPLVQALAESQWLLSELMQHDAIALVEATSARDRPKPLFTGQFNHRHRDDQQGPAVAGLSLLHERDFCNFPLSLDFDEGQAELRITAQVQHPIDPQSVCRHWLEAFGVLVQSLEMEPEQPVQTLLQALQRLAAKNRSQEPAWPLNASAVDEHQDVVAVAEPMADAQERAIAAHWLAVLGSPPRGRHDNFFDAGGHSLLAVALWDRLCHVAGARFPLASLFEHPTVAGLAQVWRGSTAR